MSAPALLPLFRSETQLDLLATVFAAPEPLTITELADRIGAPISTVSREAARLADAGIIGLVGRGRSKYVEARRDYSWAPALAELLDRTVGISATVSEEFDSIDDVELVAIFGSWAERRLGRQGPPPRDVDVLVVGAPSALEVTAAANHASQRLDIQVNPVVVSPDQWRSPGQDRVLKSIKRGPRVTLIDRKRRGG